MWEKIELVSNTESWYCFQRVENLFPTNTSTMQCVLLQQYSTVSVLFTRNIDEVYFFISSLFTRAIGYKRYRHIFYTLLIIHVIKNTKTKDQIISEEGSPSLS